MPLPPPSERGISQEPEKPTQKGKSIQELTKDDMKQIAEVTGGMFVDDSDVYNFNIGGINYYPDNNHYVSLTLREASPNRRDTHIIWVAGNTGINRVFPSTYRVVQREGSVSIESPETETPSINLTINKPNDQSSQGKVKLSILFNPR